MLLIVLKIALLLGSIIIPLRPKKNKSRAVTKFNINSDTADSQYAVNKNGMLEEINKHSLTNHN
jgi:hypothetical protein